MCILAVLYAKLKKIKIRIKNGGRHGYNISLTLLVHECMAE